MPSGAGAEGSIPGGGGGESSYGLGSGHCLGVEFRPELRIESDGSLQRQVYMTGILLIILVAFVCCVLTLPSVTCEPLLVNKLVLGPAAKCRETAVWLDSGICFKSY